MGAWLTAINALVGCAIFVFFILVETEIFDSSNFELSDLRIEMIFWAFGFIFSGMFASVPAYFGGYLLTMGLNKLAKRDSLSLSKSIFIGAVWGFIVSVGILAVGLPFSICMGSHGLCEQNPIGYLSRAIEGFPWSIHLFRILSALIIAIIVGGVTGRQIYFRIKNQPLEPENGSIH